MPNPQQEHLRFVIFGRGDRQVAEIARKGNDVQVSYAPMVSSGDKTEIAKYVSVIQASLMLGHGTYTGTITPASDEQKQKQGRVTAASTA